VTHMAGSSPPGDRYRGALTSQPVEGAHAPALGAMLACIREQTNAAGQSCKMQRICEATDRAAPSR